MTDQQINAAIAEACWWTEIDGLSAKWLMGKPPQKLCSFNYIPNYCTDLNAMHEAEEHLDGDLWIGYMTTLADIEGSLFGIRATARQRAEAFLRTLGKWKEVQA